VVGQLKVECMLLERGSGQAKTQSVVVGLSTAIFGWLKDHELEWMKQNDGHVFP